MRKFAMGIGITLVCISSYHAYAKCLGNDAVWNINFISIEQIAGPEATEADIQAAQLLWTDGNLSIQEYQFADIVLDGNWFSIESYPCCF